MDRPKMNFSVRKYTQFQVWVIFSVVLLGLTFGEGCNKKSDPTPEQPNEIQNTQPEHTENAEETKNAQSDSGVHDDKESDNDDKKSGNDDKKSDNDDKNSDDDETESDDDENESEGDGHCDDAPAAWLKDQIDKVTSFGHRHEIQGNLSQVKFSDLEPSLPFGDLKVAPGNDVVKKIESYFSVKCTQKNPIKKVADGSTVQLIFCSKSDRTRDYKDPDYSGTVPVGFYPRKEENDTCHHQVADVAYLSLVSPKDKYARVYQIGTGVDFGYVDGLEDLCRWTLGERGSLTLMDVVSKPLMDTNGLYIRTKYFYEDEIEHDTQDSSKNWKINYTTWLFAGDKLRLVKSWEDSNYKYFHEENYDEICIAYQQSEDYYENYMYYESGEFKQVQKTAHNKVELDKLISGRP